jgi:hypothetical protein
MSPATLTGPPPSAERTSPPGEGDELRLWDEADLAPPPSPAPDAAAAASAAAGEAAPRGGPRGAERGAPTLEALISGAWEGLSAHASVACPACGAEMRPRAAAGPKVAGGRCGGCGSELT